MRFIPTALHGIADYLVGLLLASLPLFLGWSGITRTTFVAIGVFIIIYSALTDYELGAYRWLRIRFHLLLDALVGLALLAAAALLPLPDHHTLIAAIGVLSLVLAATTKIRAEGTHHREDT